MVMAPIRNNSLLAFKFENLLHCSQLVIIGIVSWASNDRAGVGCDNFDCVLFTCCSIKANARTDLYAL